jgi:chromosome segregation ATPase
VLRDTTGDELPGRHSGLNPGDAPVNRAVGHDVVRALLDEMRGMETQLSEGAERLEAGAVRMEELRVQIDSLTSERDAALTSVRDAKENVEHLQRSMAALESAFDVVAEQRDAHADKARRAWEELDGWLAECEALLQQGQRHSDEIRALKQQRDHLGSELSAVREALAAAHSARNETARELDDLSSEHTDLLRRAGELELAITATNEAARVAHEQLAASQSRVQQLETHVRAANDRVHELVATNERKSQDLAARAEEVERVQRDLNLEREKREQLVARLADSAQSIESLESRIAEIELNRLQVVDERDAALKRADASEEVATALANELVVTNERKAQDLAARAEEIERVQHELNLERQEREQLAGRLADSAQTIESLESRIAEIESIRLQVVDERDAALKRAGVSEDDAAALAAEVEALRDTSLHLDMLIAQRDSDLSRATDHIASLSTQIEEKAQALVESERSVRRLSAELQGEREARDSLVAALNSAEQAARLAEERIASLALRRDEVAGERDRARRRLAELEVNAGRIAQLESDLRSALDTQDKLVASLRDAEQATRSMESRISQVFDSRMHLAQERDQLQHRMAEFQVMVTELGSAVTQAEERYADSQRKTSVLESELTNAYGKIDGLASENKAKEASITELTSRLQHVEAELGLERTTQDSLVSALRGAEAAARSTEARFAQLASEKLALASERDGFAAGSRELERKVLELESHIADSERYVTDLLQQVERKTNQIAQGSAYARSLEAKIAELEAVTAAAISERLVTREYINSLREQVAEIPLLREAQQQLVAQTEELIAQVQSESAQLVTLIDTVQASHFWKVKRWLNRLRAKAFGH